ncbi:MAG: hypothetical protein JRC92_07065 [Deltaproteobacteria bacterium]|nr:hypothetical protein [Deltaproteobacteria bacterium]
MAKSQGPKGPEKWITRYSRASERKFLFYAAMAMMVAWGWLRFLGG